MFKRKKTETATPVVAPRLTAPVPDTPAAASAAAVAVAVAEPRTTCYPQDADAPPPVVGQPRTTVYRQALGWNRGGYDTVN
jgi:hypothetical protein